MNVTYYTMKIKIIIGLIIAIAFSAFLYEAIILPNSNNNLTDINSNIDNTVTNDQKEQSVYQKPSGKEGETVVSKGFISTDSNYKQADNAINLKNFGARGEGLSSVKEDTKALEDAIDFLKKKNGGRLYIPATEKFYAYAGGGLLLSDNIEIYGDGEKSTIRNVNPDLGRSYKGVIFFTSTYGPVNKISIVSQPKYNIKDTKKGSSNIEVIDDGAAEKLSVGKVIALGASPFSKDGDINKTRYLYIELNEISAISGNTIKLKYPISVNLLTDNATKPVLINVNSESNTSFLGEKNRTSKNIQIHDLHLAQAQKNEVDNLPLQKAPASVIQLGGTFESKFYNLWIDCYSGLSGNLWSRCEFNNIVINANKNLMDWGYGSSNSKFTNIKYTFAKSAIPDMERAFIYFSEASHDIQMENIQAVGDWNGTHVLLIGNGAKGLTMKNVDINFPNLVNSNFGITIADQDNKVYSSNIVLQNVKIKVNKIKKLIRFAGKNDGVDRNIQLDDVELSDATNTINNEDLAITNMKGVHFKDVHSQKSRLDIDDVTAQKIKQKLKN